MYYYDTFICTALISSFSSADHVYEIDETVYEGKSYYAQVLFKLFADFIGWGCQKT